MDKRGLIQYWIEGQNVWARSPRDHTEESFRISRNHAVDGQSVLSKDRRSSVRVDVESVGYRSTWDVNDNSFRQRITFPTSWSLIRRMKSSRESCFRKELPRTSTQRRSPARLPNDQSHQAGGYAKLRMGRPDLGNTGLWPFRSNKWFEILALGVGCERLRSDCRAPSPATVGYPEIFTACSTVPPHADGASSLYDRRVLRTPPQCQPAALAIIQ